MKADELYSWYQCPICKVWWASTLLFTGPAIYQGRCKDCRSQASIDSAIQAAHRKKLQ